jgi:NhaA family Na+:H+ antiporter
VTDKKSLPLSVIPEFLKFEGAGGVLLIIAAAIALICDNSPLSPLYASFLETPVAIQIGTFSLAKPLLLWINDGLMAIFFFLVGLEIKREFVEGELSTPSQAALPIVAAIGGMALPAVIYAYINWESPQNLNGWAIPAATDIAFALAIITLVGSRVPLALKVLLTAIAIIDDLGAIVIIAIFYTGNLSLASLAFAGVAVVVLFALNRFRVVSIAAYILVGIVLWVCVLKSGVHATLAGVVLAMAIPIRGRAPDAPSPLRHLEHVLHPWVSYLILPVFGFANAGVSFAGMTWSSFLDPVAFGIAAGLFIGKQIGIFGTIWLAVKAGLSPKPSDSTWIQIYGMAVLCGIGFTMSLFIGTLAFGDQSYAAPIRLGVLTGSVVSAVVGYLLLRAFTAKAADEVPQRA